MFSINDTLSSGYTVQFLDILSIIAVLFGIAVIINKNPIGSLLFLIGLFATISVYLILSGLTFIGFSYLIVYIGAVSILFLFILMLINIRTSELQSNNSNSVPLGLFILILSNYSLYQLLPYHIGMMNIYNNKLVSLVHYLSSTDETSLRTEILHNINKSTKNINNMDVMFVTSNN
jgi:NADH-ubiquinone oxidoreductase chain 6